MRFQLSRRALLSAGAGTALAVVGGARAAIAAPVDEWILRCENSEGSYQSKFDELVRLGYRPYLVDGFETGQASMLSAVFRPHHGIGWRARHSMNGEAYQADFDVAVREGWRMTNVTSYLLKVGGTYYCRYAAIWETSPGPQWTAYHGIPRDEHQVLIDDLSRQGYVPINLSCVVDNDDVVRVTGLYYKANLGSWVARTMLTPAQYQQLSEENWAAGRHTSYVNACQYGNGHRFSAIWQSGAPGSGETVAQHGASNSSMIDIVDQRNQNGMLTRSIAGYLTSPSTGDWKFAGVWRKP